MTGAAAAICGAGSAANRSDVGGDGGDGCDPCPANSARSSARGRWCCRAVCRRGCGPRNGDGGCGGGDGRGGAVTAQAAATAAAAGCQRPSPTTRSVNRRTAEHAPYGLARGSVTDHDATCDDR